MLAGIHGLRHPQHHGRKRVAVDRHRQILRAFSALDLDQQATDVRLDLLAFLFRGDLGVTKCLRGVGRELLLHDLQVGLTRLHELAELGVSAGHEEQVRRRVDQRLRPAEKLERLIVFARFESVSPRVGSRPGSSPITVRLRVQEGMEAHDTLTPHGRGSVANRP